MIADAIGSYVEGGSTKNHFKILNNHDYYNLLLNDHELSMLYEEHGCFLTHNAAMSMNVGLFIGEGETDVIKWVEVQGEKKLYLNLEPFWKVSKKMVIKFLKKAEEIVNSSEKLDEILSK